MALTRFLAWLPPALPRFPCILARIKAIALFALVWAAQVAVALVVLPVVLLVLAVGGAGILIAWLTGTGRKACSPEDQPR